MCVYIYIESLEGKMGLLPRNPCNKFLEQQKTLYYIGLSDNFISSHYSKVQSYEFS